MSVPFLFIGGEADGRRLRTPEDRTSVRVPSRVQIGAYESYRLERFYAEREIIYLFIVESMTTADAMLRLIDKYPKMES